MAQRCRHFAFCVFTMLTLAAAKTGSSLIRREHRKKTTAPAQQPLQANEALEEELEVVKQQNQALQARMQRLETIVETSRKTIHVASNGDMHATQANHSFGQIHTARDADDQPQLQRQNNARTGLTPQSAQTGIYNDIIKRTKSEISASEDRKAMRSTSASALGNVIFAVTDDGFQTEDWVTVINAAWEVGSTAVGLLAAAGGPITALVVGLATTIIGGFLGDFAGNMFGPPSDLEIMQKMLEDMYKQIMEEVHLIVSANNVRNRLDDARNTLIGINEELKWVPELFGQFIDANGTSNEVSYRQTLISYFLMVQHHIAVFKRTFFVLCLSDTASDGCIDFMEQGGLDIGVQYAQVHLNLLKDIGFHEEGLRPGMSDKIQQQTGDYQGLLMSMVDSYRPKRLEKITSAAREECTGSDGRRRRNGMCGTGSESSNWCVSRVKDEFFSSASTEYSVRPQGWAHTCLPDQGRCNRRRETCKGGPCTSSNTCLTSTMETAREEYIANVTAELQVTADMIKGFGGKFHKCFDVQPYTDSENPTCEEQYRNTENCAERRSGTLVDGFCAKTCGVCQSCPDLTGLYDILDVGELSARGSSILSSWGARRRNSGNFIQSSQQRRRRPRAQRRGVAPARTPLPPPPPTSAAPPPAPSPPTAAEAATTATGYGAAAASTYCSANWNSEYGAATTEATADACKAVCTQSTTCVAATYGVPGGAYPGKCVLCASTTTASHSSWVTYNKEVQSAPLGQLRSATFWSDATIRLNQNGCFGNLEGTEVNFTVKGTINHTHYLPPRVTLTSSTGEQLTGYVSGAAGSHFIRWESKYAFSQSCHPPSTNRNDEGYPDDHRGWYDVQGCGTCNDYCRWVGDGGGFSGGDPFVHTTSGTRWWSCRLAGGDSAYTPSGYFTNWTYSKCSGEGVGALLQLQDLGQCEKDMNCRKCQGDCDKDEDCAEGLKCFKRDSKSTSVPGCASGGAGDIGSHDYCVDAALHQR